tara:strand:+ start:9067 stop:9345 length:279 start_codon:yes stop_codon:yes gene_type:complete
MLETDASRRLLSVMAYEAASAPTRPVTIVGGIVQLLNRIVVLSTTIDFVFPIFLNYTYDSFVFQLHQYLLDDVTDPIFKIGVPSIEAESNQQ